MARRLLDENQEPAIPILIDAFAHPWTWPRASRLKMRARRTLYLTRQLLGASPHKSAPALLARLRNGLQRKDASAQLRDWLLDQNPDLPAPLLRVREAGGMALARYVPRYYPGKIIFLKASHPDPEIPDDPARIWGPLAQDMDLRTVPGRHRTMVSDHAGALAECLTARILGNDTIGERSAVSSRRAPRTNKQRLQPQAG
jgi:thioesterase domain-containing protein